MKILIIILLSTNFIFCQSSIVASGDSNSTTGEIVPIMQTDMKEKEVSLSVPKFEIPTESTETKPETKPTKTIKQKKNLFTLFIDFILNLFKK